MGRYFNRSNLLYALFMVVTALILLEFTSRWYLSSVLNKSTERKFQFDSYRIYSHVPGFQESDDEGVRLSINAQGFRRTSDVVTPKPAGTVRIFLLGGSAAHGISSANPFPVAHVRDTETIDAYLEGMLTAKFPGKRIEVINAAVTGYKVFQHTAYLQTELLDYEPDLVIFFDGYNDHYKYNPSEDQDRDNIYQFWKPRLQDPGLAGLFDHFTLWASNFSGLARGYHAWRNNKDAGNWENKVQANTKGWTEEQMVAGYLASRRTNYLRSVATNLLMLRDHGIDALLCVQSGLRFRDERLLSDTERDVLMPMLHDEYRKALQPLILHDLDSVSRLYGAHLVDANSTLNDPTLAGKQLFLDYCHLSPLGSELAARTMLPEVEAMIAAMDSTRTLTLNTP
jgi:hypothetical protein